MSTPPTDRFDRRDGALLAALTAAWCALLPWLGVHGEFALSDDFAYAWTVRHWLETGEFVRHLWTWTPVYTHVGIGAVFASLLGPSDAALRASCVLFGWLTVAGAYLLCRRAGAPRGAAVLGAVVTGWSPLHVNLAYTFMTDVPFTALCVWSLLLLQEGLRGSRWALAGGVACALVATLSRQPGAALLLALPLVWLIGQRRRPERLALGIAALGAVVAAALLAPGAAKDAGQHLYSLGDHVRDVLDDPRTPGTLAINALTSLVYLGLLLAPAAAWASKPRLCLAAGGLAAAALIAIAAGNQRMPLGVNMLHGSGLGPIAMHGAEHLPQLPAAGWWLLLALGLLGGLAICLRLLHMLIERRLALLDDPARLLLVVFPVLYLAPLLVRFPFFDRYFLPMLAPLCALLLGRRPGRGATLLAGAAALLLAAFAMLGTRDYLERHRNRNALLDDLLRQGIVAARINGGFEFNGRHNFDTGGYSEPCGWVVDDEFIVSHAPAIDGCERIASREYGRALPPGRELVFVYRRR